MEEHARAAAQLGLAGLGTMGSNLALNFEDHGFTLAVWNRTTSKMERFVTENADRRLIGTRSQEEFVSAIERPRRIVIMVNAGPPVDTIIDALKPLLEPGDLLIDGGNSWFKDTQRRLAELQNDGLLYMGMGVSGGEAGARFGPSLMPGGSREGYSLVEPMLQAIAAKTDSGPCVTYVGRDGAGHFVKMVHNGIEYADMQLIAEVYDIMRKALGMTADEMADVFAEWNYGPLESFLIDLTAKVLAVRDDESGQPLVDLVLDAAAQKGTGRWAVQAAVELGVPVPGIAAAIDARVLSAMKQERLAAGGKLPTPEARYGGDRRELIANLHDALVAAKIASYAQGFSLIRAASAAYSWDVNCREVARIWKGGCIIRARLLNSIMSAFERDAGLASLLVAPDFIEYLDLAQAAWRHVIGTATSLGIPVPAMSSSLAYFDSYRSPQLPQNLTQAQRDAFGAHRYVRADRPEQGNVHTDWLGIEEEVTGRMKDER